jgi:secreted trypsin-like serine protease
MAQLFGGLVTVAVTSAGLASPAGAERAPTQRYIVNGTDAAPGAWPWIAVLLKKHPTQPGAYFQYCDGALVAPSWVLTAAHCVASGAPPMPDAVVIGRQTASDTDGDFNSAAQVIVHPSWNPMTTENDVALVKLATPSPQPTLPLIRHEQGSLWSPGTTGQVIGFGDTRSDLSPSPPDTLQQAPQTVITDAACAAEYPDGGFVSATMVCTALTPQTPCFGDSGGPLMFSDGGGGWRQVGVVSHGSSPCGQSPPVYTRLETVIDWIFGTINEPVTRLFGSDRVNTAIAVSRDAFATAGSANAAVLANQQSFADALPGTPLAAVKHGPLLLTAGDALDPRVEGEQHRAVAPGSIVYVLGGTGVMTSAINARLTQLGYTVVRYGGRNRFETATMIAEVGLGNPATLLEATGLDFADALAGGAAAAAVGGAVLLTNGSSQAAETADYLAAHGGATRFALGGPAAAADPAATKIVGGDRYATSAAVASQFFANPTVVGVASGLTFPDALAGGAHIGARSGPVLLVPPTGLIVGSVRSYLSTRAAAIAKAFLYGGPSAVSIDMAEDVGTAIT